MSNPSITPSFASQHVQLELQKNADATSLTSPSIKNDGFVFKNPSGYYNDATFISPKSCATWQPYHPQDLRSTILRRGSLPLKKRRVTMLQEDHLYPLSFNPRDGSGFRTIDSFIECETVAKDVPQSQSGGYNNFDDESRKRNPMNTPPFDKMNTLTLIAAAAAANEGGRSLEYVTFQPTNSVSFASSLSSFDPVDQMRYHNASFTTSGRDDSSVADSSASELANSSTSGGANDAHDTRSKHTHIVNMSATSASRNRDPIAASLQKPLPEFPTSSTSGQDKRYTGLSPSQMRCNATTTRGRPCTYTAVQSTKYCFLHADYDTNPPPRRIKSINDEDSGNDPSALASRGIVSNTNDCLSYEEDYDSESPTPTVESNAKVESKLHSPSVAVFKKRRTNAKFAEKHAVSLRPLLSMMATDQWFGQSVQVAVGPFEGKTGTVQKWGNGWITVLIEGVGFHNRRSFELYIDTENEQNMNEANSKHVNKKKGRLDGKIKDRNRLFRCVSRDAVSPSPTTTNSANCKPRASIGSGKKSRTVTPKPSSIVNSRTKIDGSTPCTDGVNLASSIDHPETPLPQCISNGSETPISIKSSLEGNSYNSSTMQLPTPKVTPFSEKATTVTRTLTTQDRCNADLRFPGHSDDETKHSVGIKSSDTSLVFRPSMGERTRGRSSNVTGSHSSGQSIDSSD